MAGPTMNREAAGAAIRELREARNWSLADLAAMTGVSVMGLSYLERGARKPHKTTVQKVESGLGLPPGSYARLLAADDPAAELTHLLAGTRDGSGLAIAGRVQDTEVLEAHAEAHVESISSVMARLPAQTSNDYKTYIESVTAQCVKAEMLAASSWRVAAGSDQASADRLMAHLKALEAIRADLLSRLPESIASRFDQACLRSGLPESVIAALLGVGVGEVWDLRNRGIVPPDALDRVRAFIAGES